jgi:hypothetical protein
MPDALYAGGGIGLGPRPPAEPRELYPAPEVTSRDGVAGPEKRAVRDMVRAVGATGWAAKVTYAKGHVPHATTGRPGAEPRESLAVRMWRGDQRAVAVYVDHGAGWSWDTLWILGEHPRKYPAVTAFLVELG